MYVFNAREEYSNAVRYLTPKGCSRIDVVLGSKQSPPSASLRLSNVLSRNFSGYTKHLNALRIQAKVKSFFEYHLPFHLTFLSFHTLHLYPRPH